LTEAGDPDTGSSPASTHNHHGSHRPLLPTEPDPGGLATVDAIIVPIAHRTAALGTAIGLASGLGCPLVALCSQWASAEEAAPLARDKGVELVAIDIGGVPNDLLPDFATSRLLAGTKFASTRDTSAKRNLGMLLAHLIGWQRIVFLDDDVTVPDPDDLRRAARLLDHYSIVGLSIGSFPDNSVVCHAHRETGGDQGTFIGGGALAVDATSVSSFFPDVYNEDWFFLLDGDRLRPSAITGSVTQKPYDPYANVARARSEEFGDCLAEGVFWLLDKKKTVRTQPPTTGGPPWTDG
jgi:hypothetical protein